MAKRQSAERTARGYHERRLETRELRQRFLIVCEGTRTEPNYFYGFRVAARIVPIIVRGLGCSPLEIVRRAVQIRREEEFDTPLDQVWCVFDRDDVAESEFREAFARAEHERIQIAYSNQAFELWYLLHFNYYNTAMSRADYMTKLSGMLGHRYKKNSESMYAELLPRQQAALTNARRLLEQHYPLDPATSDPSTTVHLLVEQLMRFLP